MADNTPHGPAPGPDFSQLTRPAHEAEIRVVRFMPDRVSPRTPIREFFVRTGSDSSALVALTDNGLLPIVDTVTVRGMTYQGGKGVVVRVQFKSADDVLGPVTVTILQNDITGDCAVTPFQST